MNNASNKAAIPNPALKAFDTLVGENCRDTSFSSRYYPLWAHFF